MTTHTITGISVDFSNTNSATPSVDSLGLASIELVGPDSVKGFSYSTTGSTGFLGVPEVTIDDMGLYHATIDGTDISSLNGSAYFAEVTWEEGGVSKTATILRFEDVTGGATQTDYFFYIAGDGLPTTVTDFESFMASITGVTAGTGNYAPGELIKYKNLPNVTVDQNDTITGTKGADTISAGKGNDTVDGLGGADEIDGGKGNDDLDGGKGNDTLHGGKGKDTLVGGDSNDTLNGDAGNDTMDGGKAHDTMNGGKGNDTMEGGKGNDTMNGGDGNDTMDGGKANDIMDGGKGDDTMNGGDGLDTMNGGNGKDTLNGGKAADTLNGDGGNDTLDGGANKDVLTGGDGKDTFVFNLGSSRDAITDFEDNIDTISLDSALWGGGLTEQDVVDNFGKVKDGNIVLNFGNNDILTLEGQTDLSILADDLNII
ncbi:MAG: calcium-binding protein [Pseudoruegeria sp.]